jgi:hypothetical protein
VAVTTLVTRASAVHNSLLTAGITAPLIAVVTFLATWPNYARSSNGLVDEMMVVNVAVAVARARRGSNGFESRRRRLRQLPKQSAW